MGLFGTDGVRGVANVELTPELAFKLGRAGASILTAETGLESVVIGRDTRLSGDMLEAALTAGICSVGVDVRRAGVLPTPAVAYLTRVLEAGGGVVISASHNSFEDNGIKFFGANGYKLSDELEARIEALVLDPRAPLPRPSGPELGRVRAVADAQERYIRYAASTGPQTLSGLKVVLDCAHGAAHTVAPPLFTGLGAAVVSMYDRPDGTNINGNCGSTHPEALQQAVVDEGADLGLAYDGDADRLIAVDERGRLVDGDHIMVICARYLQERGALRENIMVTTVMSNLGLHIALREAGIKVVTTRVGDRYVLEEMLRCNASLGGEQSGHIIFGDYATTGDGVVSGLQLLKVMAHTGRPLSELAAQMEQVPQVLHNVRVKDKQRVMTSPVLADAIATYEDELGDRGRILVRPSGTEPLVRVMVECTDETLLTQVVRELAELVGGLDGR